jgi:hypothetical protein
MGKLIIFSSSCTLSIIKTSILTLILSNLHIRNSPVASRRLMVHGGDLISSGMVRQMSHSSLEEFIGLTIR